MNREFHITLLNRRLPAGDGWRFAAHYQRLDGTTVADSGELWYEFDAWPEGLAESNGDPFLMVFLPMAMEEGRDLHIHGTVTQSLLRNLTEFRDFWCCLAPLRYHRIPITVDTVADDQSVNRKPGAIMLFSGGVDAAFTYWRHTRGQAGMQTQPIKQCIFVDGFDRPSFLAREEFLACCEHTWAMLADEDVPLIRVKTNYRRVEAEPFASQHLHVTSSCAAFLGSCLHLFAGSAGVGLYGSTYAYGEPDALTSGTNPVSDRFLSSSRLQVVHDGAAFTRVEKICELVKWPAFMEHVRVCYHPRADGQNCGKCEKCLRTALATLIVGGRIPEPFPLTRDTLRDALRHVHIKEDVRFLWQEMVTWAREHDIDNEWTRLAEVKSRRRWKQRRREFRQCLSEFSLGPKMPAELPTTES